MKEAEGKFSRLYNRERKEVETHLRKCLNNRKPASLYEPGKYILSGGGKRLRPLLVIFSAKAVGSRRSFYDTASAVELLHNFTLVHDDIMDNADMRRGRETLHKKHDINKALLVGDSLLSIAYELLLKDLKHSQGEIVSAFTHSLVEICEGQSLDKDFETSKEVTLPDYLIMIRKKTAELLKMCCKIGAIAGGGTAEQINALSSYGINLGIAFQIHDDLLDVTGDQVKFGKMIGGDLVEGKKTYLVLRALEKADKKYQSDLADFLNNNGIQRDQVAYFRNMFEETGIIKDTEKIIKEYTGKALRSLKKLNNPEYGKFFSWLAESLTQRKN